MKASEFNKYSEWYENNKDVVNPPPANPETSKAEKNKKKK